MARRNRRFIDNANQIRLDLDFAGAAIEDARRYEDIDVDAYVLEEAVKCLQLPDCDPDLTDDLFISDTNAKLEINRLGEPTRKLIREVINHSATVEAFIKDHAKETNDSEFPQKLRSFFTREYKKLLNQNAIFGDGLFSGVRDAVARLIPKPELKCAALSILVHLFLICDLFRRPEENANAQQIHTS